MEKILLSMKEEQDNIDYESLDPAYLRGIGFRLLSDGRLWRPTDMRLVGKPTRPASWRPEPECWTVTYTHNETGEKVEAIDGGLFERYMRDLTDTQKGRVYKLFKVLDDIEKMIDDGKLL